MAGTGLSSVQLQSLDFVGHWGDTMDDSAEILSQSFLQEAIVSTSGVGRDVYSLMLSTQRFLNRLAVRRFLPRSRSGERQF